MISECFWFGLDPDLSYNLSERQLWAETARWAGLSEGLESLAGQTFIHP
jgi:hypothetical protein